jgi:hypothetical protein
VTLPSKEEVLERERRWLRPAGLITIFGVLLFAAGVVVQQVGLDQTDTDAERLQQFHDHGGQVLAGQVLQGIAVGLFAVPLYVLFRAAQARSERVRGFIVGFCVIGPILFGISTIVFSLGIRDAADTFVDRAPAAEQEARERAEAEQASGAEQGGQPQQGEGQPQQREGQTQQGEGQGQQTETATTGTATEAASDDEEPQTPDEAAEDAREDLADDVVDDTGAATTAAALQVPAVLSLLIGLMYTSIWSMRTGLLSRFWGSLGMALAIALILLGSFGLLLTVMWFAVLGLRFAGWAPGGRPPAWDEGVAVPWEPAPMPAEREPGSTREGDVEGSGRELSESALPEEEEREEQAGGTQGERRKKRKRRG